MAHMGHDVQLILAALGKHLKRKQEILSQKVTVSLPPSLSSARQRSSLLIIYFLFLMQLNVFV